MKRSRISLTRGALRKTVTPTKDVPHTLKDWIPVPRFRVDMNNFWLVNTRQFTCLNDFHVLDISNFRLVKANLFYPKKRKRLKNHL